MPVSLILILPSFNHICKQSINVHPSQQKTSLYSTPPNLSHERTSNPIHSPLDVAPHTIPIRPAFRKLVHLLGAEDAAIPIRVRDDGREFLGLRRALRGRGRRRAVDEVDLGEFAQGGEVGQKRFLAQG